MGSVYISHAYSSPASSGRWIFTMTCCSTARKAILWRPFFFVPVLACLESWQGKTSALYFLRSAFLSSFLPRPPLFVFRLLLINWCSQPTLAVRPVFCSILDL